MPTIDPELADVLAANLIFTQQQPPPPGVPLHVHMREQCKFLAGQWTTHFGHRLPSEDQYTVSNKHIPVDGGEILVRLLTPAGKAPSTTHPVLVWLHGGGWMFGDVDMDDGCLRTICVELQLAIVNVEYRLAPEHPFPAAFEDSYAAVKWVAENATSLNVSLSKGFLLGGDSAGGNLTGAIALKARDDPFFAGRSLTGQYLREPHLLHPLAWPEELKLNPRSWDLKLDELEANKEGGTFIYNAYNATPTDLRFSPLLAQSQAGLPPAYIQVMELDLIRDDGVVYERLLREAGIKTKLVEYAGFFHGSNFVHPTLQTSIKIDRDFRDGLKWLLSLTA